MIGEAEKFGDGWSDVDSTNRDQLTKSWHGHKREHFFLSCNFIINTRARKIHFEAERFLAVFKVRKKTT